VYITAGTFTKTGGSISGNFAKCSGSYLDGEDTYGHAVYFVSSSDYYCDDNLGSDSGGNIKTTELPSSGTDYNWTKK
jgi:hypothetical protein